MKWYITNLATAVDQLVNAACNGWCDETMSSHAYRLHRDRKPWGWLMYAYDLLFFWQDSPPHCERAYLGERQRTQAPPELRALEKP